MGYQQKIAILGAGMSGIGVALSLARRGIEVTLIDQDDVAYNRASLRNEGKIHLGFIYANDPTFNTPLLQLTGALRFRSILESWIGERANTFAQSTPFVYLVANDSLLDTTALEDHYARIAEEYRKQCEADPGLDYLGRKYDILFQRWPDNELARYFDARRFAAAYVTAERAVDTAELALALREAVANNRLITFMPRHRVLEISRRRDGFRIEGTNANERWQLDADQVINAMWENRILFDQMVGVDIAQGWVHRLKYRVIARVPERLRNAPSATMVLGPYGDVVIRPDGTAYLSWYPKGLRGWTHAITPPEDWNPACRGEIEPDAARAISDDILAGIDTWYLGIGESQPLLVDAGAIVAYGRSDIDTVTSALHLRSQIGVISAGAYQSIEPGKMTTAPMYAEEAAARVIANMDFRERRQHTA